MRRSCISFIAAVTVAGSLGCQSKEPEAPTSSAAIVVPSTSPPPAATSATTAPSSMAQIQSTAPPEPQSAPVPTFSPSELNADPNANAKRVSLEEAANAWNEGSALLIDVRTDDQWKDGHIKGAIHIPESDLLSHLDQLPRQRLIITYCS